MKEHDISEGGGRKMSKFTDLVEKKKLQLIQFCGNPAVVTV